MDLISLGKSNVKVARLGVGAMTWGERSLMTAYGGTANREDEAGAFEASLEAGVNFFDTAEMYGFGNSEKRLGELARGTNSAIATKFAPRFPRSADALPPALDRSLARLQREDVDLYQIHYPVRRIKIADLMQRLADVAVAGKAKAVGVSNFTADQMREANDVLSRRGIPLASNQVQYSLLYRRAETDDVLDACCELGVTLIAYMPLAMGALSGKYGGHAKPHDWMRRLMAKTFRGDALRAIEPVVEGVRAVGERYGKTTAQVALRWLIEQGALPIPGAKNPAQARENAGAPTFSLLRNEIDELARVSETWMQHREWARTPTVGA